MPLLAGVIPDDGSTAECIVETAKQLGTCAPGRHGTTAMLVARVNTVYWQAHTPWYWWDTGRGAAAQGPRGRATPAVCVHGTFVDMLRHVN